MLSENVMELVDGAYKIKPNQNNITNDQNSVEGTPDDFLGKTLSPLVIQLETTIFPKSQETTECPFNQPQTPKRPLKPVVDDLTKSSVSCQNIFPEAFFRKTWKLQTQQKGRNT